MTANPVLVPYALQATTSAPHVSCKELMITDVQNALQDMKANTVKGVHLVLLVIQVFQEVLVKNVSVTHMDHYL